MTNTTPRPKALLAAAVWLLVQTVPAWAAVPPTETLERLEEALSFLESQDQPVAFTIKTRSVVAKPNGKDREEVLTELRVSREPGAESERTLINAVRNGEDVTAEVREEMDHARLKRRRKAEKESGKASVSVTLPDADELGRHRFEAPVVENGILVAAFVPGDADGDDAGSGRLAWDPATLDPVWMEMVPAEKPKHVKRMSIRVELERMADRLVLARTVTEGLGGFLFIKRTFEMEMVVTDVTLGEAE